MKDFCEKVASLLSNGGAIVMSWGVMGINAYEDGVEFEVNGFKFKGTVRVVPNGKACNVIYLKGGKVEKVDSNIKLEKLVDTIDNYVEKTDNYDADRKDWVLDEITKMTGMDARGFKNIIIV